MNDKGCANESAVARAARTGVFDEALARHARECTVCSEVAATAVAMQRLAANPPTAATDSATLPDAGLLWWKHELMERYAARERATRPIRIMEALTGTVGLLALLTVVTIAGLLLPDALQSVAAQGSSQLLASALAGDFTLSADILLTATALAFLVGAALLYPLWREQ